MLKYFPPATLFAAAALMGCGARTPGVASGPGAGAPAPASTTMRPSQSDSAAVSDSIADADTVLTLQRLRREADSFVRAWRYYWEVSESHRFLSRAGPSAVVRPGEQIRTVVSERTWDPPPGVDRVVLSAADSLAVERKWRGTVARADTPRDLLIHCHPSSSRDSPYDRVEAYVIESGDGQRATCPSWYPRGFSPPWDERRGIDNAIIEPLQPIVRAKREELLRRMAEGVKKFPGDEWLTGQQVRFLLDQSDSAAAGRAVAECTAAAWWCTALRGYLLQLQGSAAAADTTFRRMALQMDSDMRCVWTDVSYLIPDRERRSYVAIPCDDREAVNETFWWLSDAEFGDSVNDRRAEHFARMVMYQLRASTSFHERWDMRIANGGSAVREMLVRYGWPSFSFWGGRDHDVGHFQYLNITAFSTMNHGRFATAEYTSPRFRVVPAISAVLDPTSSRDFDWAMSGEAHASVYPSDTLWWPSEHYERAKGPIVQLWSQHGMFRRDESILLAIASGFHEADFGGVIGDTLSGWLYSGLRAGAMTAEAKSAIVGSDNVMMSDVSSAPQLISLELHGRRPAGVLARTRFGVRPPPDLRSMSLGEIAVSDPVLIRPVLEGELPAGDPAQALARMYGAVVFRDPGTLGVYWETYGVAANDSVDIQVTVEQREVNPGFMRRLGMSLGFAPRSTIGSSIQWSETQQRDFMRIESARVPVHGRVLTIDLSRIGAGDYTLHVTLSREGQQAVTGSRDFWIVD